MDQKKIKTILSKHKKWLASNGKSGARADFKGADLKEADFQGLDLRQSNFKNAVLIGCNFKGANLSEVNFEVTFLRGANLEGCMIDKAIFKNSDLQETVFDNSTLTETNLEACNLWLASFENAVMKKAIFDKANLKKTNLKNSDFSQASLWETDLQEAVLENANFVEAYLWGTSFQGTSLINTRFTSADLTNADFFGAEFRGTDFESANLRRTSMLKVKIGGDTNFNDANASFIVVDEISADVFPMDIQTKYRHTWDVRDEQGNPLNIHYIIRSVELPPEHRHIASLILSQLGSVLKDKHKDKMQKFRIEQDGIKITMIIETDKGEKEAIEDTISDYGLMISGKMSPQEFTDNQLQLREIKQLLAYMINYQKSSHSLLLDGIGAMTEKSPADDQVAKNAELSHFTQEHEVQIKSGPLQGGFLIINGQEVSLSSKELDMCNLMADQLKKDWYRVESQFADAGWVSYDSFMKNVDHWKESDRVDFKTNPQTINKAVGHLWKKIEKETGLAGQSFIENGRKLGTPGHYRFIVHPDRLVLES